MAGAGRSPKYSSADLAVLRLSDGITDRGKSGGIDTALLCKLAAHPYFVSLLDDIQIYVNGAAATQIQSPNAWVDVRGLNSWRRASRVGMAKPLVCRKPSVGEGGCFSSRVQHGMNAIHRGYTGSPQGQSSAMENTIIFGSKQR